MGDIAGKAGIAVGGIYLYFRSKRQLLLVLMDDFLERLAGLNVTPRPGGDVRSALHDMLLQAFSVDRHYLGACRAWAEAVSVDHGLEKLDRRIREWTTGRVRRVFRGLQALPGARRDVDAEALAETMDVFFWNQLARAAAWRPGVAHRFVDSATDLVYHVLYMDS